MSRTTRGKANASNADPALTFLDRLALANDRLMREGPNVQDVASALGIAQFFPGIFAVVYDTFGRYLWVSDSFSSVIGIPASNVLGRSISEMFDPEWCDERMALIRRVLDTCQPLATVEVFRGRRVEGALLPVDAGIQPQLIAYLGRFGLAISSVPVPAEQLVIADWGPLSVLTRRELEVLRLIASGRDNAGIAERIHRTKRAVEWHIQKLYELLNCTQRTELFRAGLVAGLPDIDEAHWERMMARVRAERHPAHEPPTDGSSAPEDARARALNDPNSPSDASSA